MRFRRLLGNGDVEEALSVVCDKCGHVILASRADFVMHDNQKVFFCPDHRPPYDERFRGYPGRHVYCRNMEVDPVTGDPLGYTKKGDQS